MPEISTSPLGYVGILAVAFGVFLILAGFGVINFKQIDVRSGPKTWGVGVFITVLGLLFLLPDILDELSQFPRITPSVVVLATPTDTPTPKLPTNTPTHQPSETPTSKPTSPPSPTPQPITVPATNTPSLELPTATPTIAFRDEFNNTFASGWSWVHEDSSHWSLTDLAGFLRLVIQPGNIGYGEPVPNNLLLREVTVGNFEIATLVNFNPTANYEFAGLIIYQDDENAIQFGRAFCDAIDVCVGNGIYFDTIQNELNLGANYPTTTLNQSQAYLRLRREGSTL